MSEFGVFIPSEGRPYSQLRGMAEKTEQLGYDGIWISDHVHARAQTKDSWA